MSQVLRAVCGRIIQNNEHNAKSEGGVMRKMVAAAAVAGFLSVAAGCASLGSAPWDDSVGALLRTSDVGEVRVKAFPVLRFEDIRARLAPGLTLSAEDAVLQAIATTMLDDRSTHQSTRVALELTGPVLTAQRIQKFENGVATTDTEEVKTVTGTAPPAGPAVVASAPVDALRTLAGTGIADARLVQFVAAGLRQDVAWINNYVQNIAVPKGYRASLVTLHVAVQPHRSNLPVNAMVDISVWPTGSNLKKLDKDTQPLLPLVMVQPVMMTDNLEANSRNLKAHRERDISVGASAPVGIFNARAGVENSAADQRQRLGQDLNGVTTVGFPENNRITLRLGAQATVSAGEQARGLVSRSHIVSALVMTHESIESLTVNSETYYVDLRDNRKICDHGVVKDKDCERRASQEAFNFGMKLQPCKSLRSRLLVEKDKKTNQEARDNDDLWRDFKGLVRDGRLGDALQCMNAADLTDRELPRFFAAISGDDIYGRISSFELPLPEALPSTRMPPKQLVLLTVEKDSVTAFVTGGGALDPRSLEVFLHFKDGKRIPALRVAATADGRGLTMQFARRMELAAPPSNTATTANASKGKADPGTTEGAAASIAVYSAPSHVWVAPLNAKSCLEQVSLLNAKSCVEDYEHDAAYLPDTKPKAAVQPSNPFQTDSDVVIVDSRGRAELLVRLPQAFFKDRAGLAPPAFTISGAQVASVQGAGASSSGDGVVMVKAGIAVLALRNVIPLKPLVLQAIVDEKLASSPLTISAVRAGR